MSSVKVTFSRTVGRARNLSSTALAIGAFLAATALLFALGLERAEGSSLTLAAVWAAAVSPVLPVLAAVLSMDVWSDERLSGRIDSILSVSVLERDIVIGKFLGVWSMCMLATLVSLAACMIVLSRIEPSVFVKTGMFSFVPGILALAIQSFLWCSFSVVMSALFRHAAAAACMSVAFLCGLPRGLWAALLAWSPEGRTIYGEMPFDAHALDMALGFFPVGIVLSYVIVAFALLFVCIKCVESMRLVGRGAVKSRMSTGFVVFLSLVLAWLLVALAARLNIVAGLPVGLSSKLSQRTRGILAESSGEVFATCFLPRNDPRFRPVGHMLRLLRTESTAQGGANIVIRYVDPRWDLGDAQRLVRSGISEDSVVFERNRRRIVVPLSDSIGERIFASAILKLSTHQSRNTIYWTKGHGEVSFGDYSAFGMSDISRELSRDGFHNLSLDLSIDSQIPSDCALIIVAGAKEDFSRVETERLDSYLRRGGRLLALVGEDGYGVLTSVMSAWGLRLSNEKPIGAKTFSGSDIVAPISSTHAVTTPLAGTQIVFEHPIALEPSAMSTASSADGVEFTELVRAGGRCLAAAVERGNDSGSDLALRPTRMVVIGDSLFAMNGQLLSRGNANMNFFMNCVAYLAGTGALTSGGEDGDRFVTGMDRDARIRYAQLVVGVIPFAAFVLLLAYSQIRRRRS